MNTLPQMVKALIDEIEIQKDYLDTKIIDTIYLGGGTPSLLSSNQLNGIIKKIYNVFNVTKDAEITLEANPDDLTWENLQAIKDIGINRLSIGVQTFDDSQLKYLNRSHSSIDAIRSYEQAKELGFSNISVDLIYGVPSNDHKIWEKDLEQIKMLSPEHLSCYCLTIEEKTVFGNWLKKNRITQADDEYTIDQLQRLILFSKENNYEQYEISNFCKDGFFSRHNSNYWKKGTYLGIGPGAHSYNGMSRSWNIANNIKYIDGVNNREPIYSVENLSKEDHINEYIITSLRTIQGSNIETLLKYYNFDILTTKKNHIKTLIENNMIVKRNNSLVLSEKGKLIADEIACQLMI